MNNNEERVALVVPEKKEKLERIKKKYNNMAMDDETATKVRRLDIANNVLKTASFAVGIATVVDCFIPDQLPFMDEAILTGLTMLLRYSSSLVENKAKKLASEEDASLDLDEISTLTQQIGDVAKIVKGKTKAKA